MKSRVAGRWVGRVWPGLFLLLLAVCLFGLADDYGLSWDEPTRWNSGEIKIDYYERLFTAEDKLAVMQQAPRDVYPGLYDMTLALARRSLDADPIWLSRLWNTAFGFLALWGTYVLGRRMGAILDRPRSERLPSVEGQLCGVVAVLLLLCIPEFFGHIFINPKDIPFAATYVWALVALTRAFRDAPRIGWGSLALFGVATGLCMSTRPPGVVFLGYYGLAGLAWALCLAQKGVGWKAFGALTWRGAVAGLLALATMLPWWPSAHRNPFAGSAEAVGKLHSFSDSIPVLFQGEMYDAGSTPFYYVVWMFLIKVPLWLYPLMAYGLWRCAEACWSWKELKWAERRRALEMGVVVLAIAFPMVYVLATQPAIHNGFRHMLYVLPPLAALLAVAWWDAVARMWRMVWLRCIALAATAAVLLFGGYTLWRLHPYQYVYYNEIVGGPAGALSRYETEYWFTSNREALGILTRRMEEESVGEAKLMITGPWQAMEPYLPETIQLVGNEGEADYFIGNTQMRVDTLVEGEVIGQVERAGLPIAVVKDLGGR